MNLKKPNNNRFNKKKVIIDWCRRMQYFYKKLDISNILKNDKNACLLIKLV